MVLHRYVEYEQRFSGFFLFVGFNNFLKIRFITYILSQEADFYNRAGNAFPESPGPDKPYPGPSRLPLVRVHGYRFIAKGSQVGGHGRRFCLDVLLVGMLPVGRKAMVFPVRYSNSVFAVFPQD